MGQRKNLSPRQESNPWPPERWVGALSTELRELMESKVILLSSYVTYCIKMQAQVKASACKAQPKGVPSRPKFSTWIYIVRASPFSIWQDSLSIEKCIYNPEVDLFCLVCRLNNSIPHVRKQLQSLWRRKIVNLLFEDLLIISESENNELKNKDDKGSFK